MCQLDKCFADRRAADAETAHQIAFREALSFDQSSAEYVGAQSIDDLLAHSYGDAAQVLRRATGRP